LHECAVLILAPPVNRLEAETYGAEVILVDGLIDEGGRVIRERAANGGWVDISTLREPYRAEGKKTMGYELAEAGGSGETWCPDVIVFPTGGGMGIVGMWKAFDELGLPGWIGERLPYGPRLDPASDRRGRMFSSSPRTERHRIAHQPALSISLLPGFSTARRYRMTTSTHRVAVSLEYVTATQVVRIPKAGCVSISNHSAR
jgi:hypothetical protein